MLTSIYAIPLAVMFVILSARVITYRRSNQIGLGDQGDKSLLKRMRAHANFAEYTPFGLLLMFFLEMTFEANVMVHIAGGLLVVGRVAHAYGFSASPPVMKLRVMGMALTLTSILVSISGLSFHVIAAL